MVCCASVKVKQRHSSSVIIIMIGTDKNDDEEEKEDGEYCKDRPRRRIGYCICCWNRLLLLLLSEIRRQDWREVLRDNKEHWIGVVGVAVVVVVGGRLEALRLSNAVDDVDSSSLWWLMAVVIVCCVVYWVIKVLLVLL